ncbi:hypothetical protein HK101_011385 [Irineochytrium annulatum]|nr:hypothetical protein HK101_011385 [Irineochytrium annulatum]
MPFTNEYLLRNILSHLNPDTRLGRLALLSTVLASYSMFDVAIPFLWSTLVIDTHTARVCTADVIDRDGGDGYKDLPLRDWLDVLETATKDGGIPTAGSKASRIALYLKSIPALLLGPAEQKEADDNTALSPGAVDQYMDVRHVLISPVSRRKPLKWGGWLMWLNTLVGDHERSLRVRAVTLNVQLPDASRDTLGKVMNLEGVTNLCVHTSRVALSDVLKLRKKGVDQLVIVDRFTHSESLSFSEDDAREINRLASRSPRMKHITWSLDSMMATTTAVPHYLLDHDPSGYMLSPEDIIVQSAESLRDMSLLGWAVELLDQDRIVKALRNVRTLHLCLEDVEESTVDALCQLVEIVDLSLDVDMLNGTGSWSIDAALLNMKHLRKLKLISAPRVVVADEDDDECSKLGFVLTLTQMQARHIQTLELMNGALVVDDVELRMPELEELSMHSVSVELRDGSSYMEGMKVMLAESTSLLYCRFKDEEGDVVYFK